MVNQAINSALDVVFENYQGALIRLATLRANKQQYLLFGCVELYPFDMRIPERWTAGDEPWRVPKSDSWTCGFSAWPVSVATALDWYEAAAKRDVTIETDNGRKIKVQATQFGPEPAYGDFCTGVNAPFELRWHDGPRVHRYVPDSDFCGSHPCRTIFGLLIVNSMSFPSERRCPLEDTASTDSRSFAHNGYLHFL